jgi:hypothetical protein
MLVTLTLGIGYYPLTIKKQPFPNFPFPFSPTVPQRSIRTPSLPHHLSRTTNPIPLQPIPTLYKNQAFFPFSPSQNSRSYQPQLTTITLNLTTATTTLNSTQLTKPNTESDSHITIKMCTTTIVGNIAIAIISVEIAAGVCFRLWKYIQQRRNAKVETGSGGSAV